MKSTKISPLLFSIVIGDAIKNSKGKCTIKEVGNWKMETVTLQELMFAQDMMLVAVADSKYKNIY